MDNLFLTEDVMFKALLRKDKTFEGQFIVGVKTTGIFCRPSCTARKPKKENVEFFDSTKSAMASGYRPCKVCKPLVKSGEIPEEIKKIHEEQLAQLELEKKEAKEKYGSSKLSFLKKR